MGGVSLHLILSLQRRKEHKDTPLTHHQPLLQNVAKAERTERAGVTGAVTTTCCLADCMLATCQASFVSQRRDECDTVPALREHILSWR